MRYKLILQLNEAGERVAIPRAQAVPRETVASAWGDSNLKAEAGIVREEGARNFYAVWGWPEETVAWLEFGDYGAALMALRMTL